LQRPRVTSIKCLKCVERSRRVRRRNIRLVNSSNDLRSPPARAIIHGCDPSSSLPGPLLHFRIPSSCRTFNGACGIPGKISEVFPGSSSGHRRFRMSIHCEQLPWASF
jgi:hypothetical protein